MEIPVESPPGGTLLEAVVCLKMIDADGEMVWESRATEGLSTLEAIGMLRVTTRKLEDAFNDQEEDD